jgi:Na+/H+ antiporter NhaA
MNNHEALSVNIAKPQEDSGSIKFFTIIAFLGIGFGVSIVLSDLMFHPILSALAALIFIFIGGTCALIATAKFLKALDEQINPH